MSSILIFHENPEYRASLALMLQGQPYQVTQCGEAVEMVQRLQNGTFDLLILDLCPDGNGGNASLLAGARRACPALPILVVTETPCLETALDALHFKAYDYLQKSTPPDQLLKRIDEILNEVRGETCRKEILDQMQAILDNFRAANPGPSAAGPQGQSFGGTLVEDRVLSDQCLRRGPFTVKLSTHELFWQGKPINLSPTEFNYWVVLLRHEPNVITHKALVMEAQGYDLGGREAMNLARWHIHMLRQTLDKEMGDDPIQTIRGVGYRLLI